MDPHYILDTNILIHLVRDDSLGQWIGQRYPLFTVRPIPVYSIVTAGEILSFALRKRWGGDKLARLAFLLDYFECVFVDDLKVADDFAMIDQFAQDSGFKLGKNDLWIAAAAYGDRLTLLTTGRDFDPLAGQFIDRDWIDPITGGVP